MANLTNRERVKQIIETRFGDCEFTSWDVMNAIEKEVWKFRPSYHELNSYICEFGTCVGIVNQHNTYSHGRYGIFRYLKEGEKRIKARDLRKQQP